MWGRRSATSTSRFFLVRLFATFVGTLVLVGFVLFQLQSHDAQHIAIADGAKRHLAQGAAIEEAYSSASGGEDRWSEVREVLRHVKAVTEVEDALVISTAGRAVAASDPQDEGTPHGSETVSRVLATGEAEFEQETYDGDEVFEYLSLIRLGGEPYVYEVELKPVALTEQLTSLKLASLKALGIGVVLAFPSLWLLGGRTLAGRYSAAADKATRDGLTGLNNHRTFQEALAREVNRAQRYGEALTLALIDIDDFKFVNDTGGHRKGDQALVHLAGALRGSRSVDLPFRIGGDEFALLMPHTGIDQAVAALDRVRQAAEHRMGGTTVSVGVAEMTPDSDGEVLRDQADTALYEAKRRGRDQLVTFAQIVDSAPARASAATLSAVRELLRSRRMSAAFQPIWNLDTETILGYEGLARPAEEYGLSGPAEAFAGAARLGRVDQLDALCRESVLRRAGELPEGVLLFLNVSPEVFDHGGGASRLLHDEVLAAGLHPRQVVIELTEHASERMDLVADQIQQLRDLGFQLALDDVGAGDTGLGLLGRVRPQFVKVDRNVLVSSLDGGPGRAVLAAVFAYAGESGATVIAEGIETDEMLGLVQSAGTGRPTAPVVGGQGYLLGRPHADPPWHGSTSPTWPLEAHGAGRAVTSAP